MNIHLRMKVRGKGPAELQAHICCLAGTGWQTVKGQLPLSDSAWFSTMNIAWYTRASTACRAKDPAILHFRADQGYPLESCLKYKQIDSHSQGTIISSIYSSRFPSIRNFKPWEFQTLLSPPWIPPGLPQDIRHLCPKQLSMPHTTSTQYIWIPLSKLFLSILFDGSPAVFHKTHQDKPCLFFKPHLIASFACYIPPSASPSWSNDISSSFFFMIPTEIFARVISLFPKLHSSISVAQSFMDTKSSLFISFHLFYTSYGNAWRHGAASSTFDSY